MIKFKEYFFYLGILRYSKKMGDKMSIFILKEHDNEEDIKKKMGILEKYKDLFYNLTVNTEERYCRCRPCKRRSNIFCRCRRFLRRRLRRRNKGYNPPPKNPQPRPRPTPQPRSYYDDRP